MSGRLVELLLVDDHHVVQLGLAAPFKTVPHCAVAGETCCTTTLPGAWRAPRPRMAPGKNAAAVQETNDS